MRVLVATFQHGLLPFAWRLKREGVEVEVLIRKEKRYGDVWEGRLPKFNIPDKSTDKQLYSAIRDLIDEADLTVITDNRAVSKGLVGAKSLFPVLGGSPPPTALTRLWVGGWFTGETFLPPHLFIEDVGLWPGGLGPAVPAGGTLIQGTPLSPTLSAPLTDMTDDLKSRSFKGLARVAVGFTPQGAITALGWEAGWPFLHSHAFVSELPSLSDLLMGVATPPVAPYVVVMPVSVPPWPLKCNLSSTETFLPVAVNGGGPGIPREVLKSVFFHDIKVKDSGVEVAGTDGLVGVVRGAGGRLSLAQGRALAVAGSLELPERQYRQDVSRSVEGVLGVLEVQGLIG